MMMQVRHRLAAGLLLTGALTLGLQVEPAMAIDGNCTSSRGTIVQTGYDLHNVSARCTLLNATREARGTLAVDQDFDRHTSWFTQLNTTYNSSYVTCAFGCTTRVDFQNR